MIAERKERGVTVVGLCRLAGFSRQAYYKGTKVRRREAVDREAIVEQVRRVRRIHPRLGGRKLLWEIGGELETLGIRIGRDRFFRVLRSEGLLVKRRRGGPRTTDSRHGWRVYPNRVRHIVPSAPDQVWVSDLTYLRSDEGFVYLSVITDGYSRKIVGWHAGDSLEAAGAGGLAGGGAADPSLGPGDSVLLPRVCEGADPAGAGDQHDRGAALLRERESRAGQRDLETGVWARRAVPDAAAGEGSGGAGGGDLQRASSASGAAVSDAVECLPAGA